jgi:hypothetical protein
MRQTNLGEGFTQNPIAETQIKPDGALARVQHYSANPSSAGFGLQCHDQLCAQPSALVSGVYRHLSHLGQSIRQPLQNDGGYWGLALKGREMELVVLCREIFGLVSKSEWFA